MQRPEREALIRDICNRIETALTKFLPIDARDEPLKLVVDVGRKRRVKVSVTQFLEEYNIELSDSEITEIEEIV